MAAGAISAEEQQEQVRPKVCLDPSPHPAADALGRGCGKASGAQAAKAIGEVFGQEVTRGMCSCAGPTEAAIKRNTKFRKM